MLKKLFRHFLRNKYFVFIAIVGTVTWSLTMVRSGLIYDFGYGFWGANGHDGIWHIALAESLARGLFDNPVFAGSALQNYHLGFDLLLALINQVTKLPINYLYFQILPSIFAVLIGFLTYKFVYSWKHSTYHALLATFFVYFSSSFGFIVTFLRNGTITGESMFWSSQSLSTLVNPPFALSLIFLLSGLVFLLKYQKTHTTYYILLSTLFFGLLIFVKVYAGLLILAGLFAAGVYEFFLHHRSYILHLFFWTSVVSSLLFFPFIDLKSGGLAWQPFWFLETLMSYSDRLGWERFYSAMTTYKMGGLWFKAIVAYGMSFVIFLVGNLGIRIVGFRYFKKIKLDWVNVFIFTILFFAVIIPMLFVQKGTPWNTIQFFYYFLFFFAILAGISMKKRLLILVLPFAMVGVWATLQHYLPSMPQAKISTQEIEALNFLENQPQGIVLTYPFDQYKAKEAEVNPPRPLYFYDSTAYVSAYSKKQVFLEDEVNLNIMGYDWKGRREDVLWFISNLDPGKGREFLRSNKIKYLYLVKENSPLIGEYIRLGESDLELKKLFENEKVIIYSYGEDFGSN